MKIAFEARPIKWSYGTGIGNYTFSLLKKINEIDQRNSYTFLWPDENPSPYIPVTNYSFYALPKDDLREEAEIPVWLENEGADLFHLPQNGFRTPQVKSTKIIVTIHDLIPYFLPEMVRSSFLRRFTDEMPLILERADCIITVSEYSKQDLIKLFHLDPAKIKVIPSAPSGAFYQLPETETKKRLREKFNLKRPYLLYVGGLNPRKNVTELIYAYSKVYRDLPLCHQLVILGPAGKHREKLELMVKALDLENDVVFPGFVSDNELPFFYNGADLFVYPSLYEGFGLPPIEAMACGTAVITSNVSSMPEIVGDAAIKINPTDTLQLAAAIYKVLTEETLRKELIAKGLIQSQKYNWSDIAAAILKLYEQVVNCDPLPAAAE